VAFEIPEGEVAMKTILLVYDDTASLRTLSRILESASYHVTPVAHVSFVMGVFHATMPDLVILDVCLQQNWGSELCRQIRNESQSVPLFVMSSSRSTSDAVLLLDLGADDYVFKSLNPWEVLARVRAVMRRSIGCSITDRLTTRK
jgi:DNA-binding response OmpR family regulator